MTQLTVRHRVGADRAAALDTERDDWLVAERRIGPGNFELEHGPFTKWHRRIRTEADEVVEEIEFRVATPIVSRPIGRLLAWAVRRGYTEAPFWAPNQRFDRAGAQALPLLVIATMAAAYLGTLLSQTITFVADDFGANREVQGLVTGMTRAGALLALAVVWLADRVGRRVTLLGAGAASAVFAALAALANSIWWFGTAELVSRGFATGFALLIAVYAAEESPEGSRAWTTSILALFAGLGSGMVLWLVPLADSGPGRWRILFVLALLVLPILLALRPRLGESRRFRAIDRDAEPAPITSALVRRFGLLATVTFAAAMFAAPASNFQNEYLRDERGFSGIQISVFSAVTSTPIGIGVAIFGPIADRRGRRIVGFIGLVGGIVFGVVRYGLGGPLMWIAATAATIIGAATIPALGVYGPELFPTSRRGLANGLLTCVAVVGAVIGLYSVGVMSDRWGFGPSFALIAIVPLVASLLISRYPETSGQTLESLNPGDSFAARRRP